MCRTVVIVSPGKCGGSAIAARFSQVRYSHGPFFCGFTRTAKIGQPISRRLKILVWDAFLFARILMGAKVLVLVRSYEEWYESMFWQDFPLIYCDGLVAGVIGNKDQSEPIQRLFNFWIEQKALHRWVRYFLRFFFWSGLNQRDFLNISKTKLVRKGRFIIVDYHHAFDFNGDCSPSDLFGLDLKKVNVVNRGEDKWYADLRKSYRFGL